MISLGLTIMPARDGGLVVYANYDSEDQGLVLAGNAKEVNEYIAKRIGEIGQPQPVLKEVEKFVRTARNLNVVALDVDA